ncbi:MAG: DUF1456 family protein, partial [Proteobacteria bacterium]
VRHMLDLKENDLAKILKLGGAGTLLHDVNDFLRPEEHPDYLVCNDYLMDQFLDGLVIQQRGPREGNTPAPPKLQMSNNVVLKKLRVAFNLREEDVLEIFSASGFKIGRAELSAFFRRPDHQNYRECGDQVLRNFLKGLTQRLRK